MTHRYPPRLEALTTLRFVAAAMVVAAHGSGRFDVPLGMAWPYAFAGALSFFFVLSGFVLAYNYPDLAGGAPIRRFLVLRVARIWPMHLAGIAVALAVIPAASWVFPGIDITLAAVLVLTLTQTWFVLVAGYAGAFNPPSWTLSVDLALYLAFPWLLARVRVAPWRALAFACAASVACPLIATVLGPLNRGDPVTSWNWYMLDRMFPVARLAEFVLGMAIARTLPQARMHLPSSRAAATLVEIGVLATVGVCLAWMHRVLDLAPWIGPALPDWLGQVGIAPLGALAIVVLSHGRGIVSAALASRPAVLLGNLGFAVYIIHLPFLTLDWPRLAASIGRWPAVAVASAALLATALTLYRGVELPARRAIIRAYERREAAGAAAASRLPTS
ncbi:MAG: acyltransferase [Betaproteobacteria bacterium]